MILDNLTLGLGVPAAIMMIGIVIYCFKSSCNS